MDNEEIVIIERKSYVEGQDTPDITEIKYHFKLQSQSVVNLEKVFGKNIFEIFAMMSFTNMQIILDECRMLPSVVDKNVMMDDLLTKYSLIELGEVLLQNIAIKSGLVKKAETETENEAVTDPNA